MNAAHKTNRRIKRIAKLRERLEAAKAKADRAVTVGCPMLAEVVHAQQIMPLTAALKGMGAL